MDAKYPSLSNLFFEFFLIQVSIKQFPGPMSLLIKLYLPTGSLIMVKFDIPPILRIHIGNSSLYLVVIN